MQSAPGVPSSQPASRRYEVLFKLAAGGMATVYLGYLRGGLGFRQVVAIKRPHPHLLGEEGFRKSFVTEANLACRIHHANVVDVRDIDVTDESIDLVMDYVEGASLSRLLDVALRSLRPMPPSVVLRIALDSCAGLHAAHEATDELGQALRLVHRDVSPQNILVGVDGVSRVTDFGIAKCVFGGGVTTQQGTLKGKLAYMSPEYLVMKPLDRRADVFAMGALIWESLMGQRLFVGTNEPDTIMRVLNQPAPPLSGLPQEVARWLDPVLARALAKDPDQRYGSAVELADGLEEAAHRCGLRPNHREVAAFVAEVVGGELEARRVRLREMLAMRATAFNSEGGAFAASDSASGARVPGSGAHVPGSGSFGRPAEAATVTNGSAVSAAQPRPASRWWLAPLLLAVFAVFGVVAFGVYHFVSLPRPAGAPAVPSAAEAQDSAPLEAQPAAPPSGSAAVAEAASAAAQPAAAPSARRSPARPIERTPARTAAPGPPPNPYDPGETK
jgi:serine/threonine-protein kinase